MKTKKARHDCRAWFRRDLEDFINRSRNVTRMKSDTVVRAFQIHITRTWLLFQKGGLIMPTGLQAARKRE